ncbi:hypothetical protein BGZ46_009430 [Entomortierella lignicola]|nr:hypothetical protein BGZ46_009430 [Entomortierella lignicola]
MSTTTPQRKQTSTLLFLIIAIIAASALLVQTTDAAPTRHPSKAQKRNPFLIHNVEVTGHDSSHQDLARSLGVYYPVNKRLDSVLGGRTLHGDDRESKRQAYVSKDSRSKRQLQKRQERS